MTSSLKQAMYNQYQFITAYENLLYDADVLPSDTGFQNISISNETISGDAKQGTIWYVIKNKGDDYGLIHLINLTGENDEDWRNVTGTPNTKQNLTIKYYIPQYKDMRDEGETKLTPQEQSLNEEIEKLQDQWPYLMNEIFFIDYLKNPTYERGLAAKSKILVCFNDELLAAFLSAYKKANISEQQEMLTILKEISFRGGAVERDETDTEVTRKNLEKLENALNSEVEHTSDAVKKFYANRHLETVKQIRQKFLNTREM